jgi:hypothetical protein
MMPFSLWKSATWSAILLVNMTASAWSQALPGDLDDALRKNLGKYVFKDFSVTSSRKDDEGLWVCGKINIQIWPGGVSTFIETDFVGQIWPEEEFGSRSVITTAGPLFPAGQASYDKYCQ